MKAAPCNTPKSQGEGLSLTKLRHCEPTKSAWQSIKSKCVLFRVLQMLAMTGWWRCLLLLTGNFWFWDSSNPYSKAKFDDDLRALSNQLKNASNQKQATALTNTMLLKLLEVSQKQYELSLNIASMNANEKKSPSQEISYTKEKPKIIKTEDLETVKRFKE